jgi:DNA topoisomerase II
MPTHKSVKKDKSTKKHKKQKNEDIYKKKTHHEHILSESDMYIGTIKSEEKKMWIYDDDTEMIILKEIDYIAGLYKIFDEILVNARDQTIRDKTCKTIKISIDSESGEISVYNDGIGIPVEIHKEYDMYIPTMIFGHLLTSSNYEQEDKTTGGKYGYGAKLTNIYSKSFVVETSDKKTKMKFHQKFTDNMYKSEKPVVKKYSGSPHVLIKFIPDYERFGVDNISDDMVALFKKRVYDLAACTKSNIKVYLNDVRITIKDFKEYIYLYYKKNDLIATPVFEEANKYWRVGVVYQPDSGFDHISFVNGIWTYQGGSHVEHVMTQIVDALTKHIKKKHKDIMIKPAHIRDNLTLFLDCVIHGPKFPSQTKEFMASKVSDFKQRCTLSDGFIKQLMKTGVVDDVVQLAKLKALAALKKTDGTKKSSLRGMAKLEDAVWAGTRKGHLCRLILTEGDSAKTFAIDGLSNIGREKYGVFPLKGKMMNVRDASTKQIMDNDEITNVKKIMGLKQNKKYTDTKQLRYGGIIILTDQDVDGSHIKGLIMNFIHFFWPSLAKIEGFIQSLTTPIIKVFKSTNQKGTPLETFYTLSSYNQWKEKQDDISKFTAKYYKGLGTSTRKEAIKDFTDIEKKLITYTWDVPDEDGDSESEDESESELEDESESEDESDKESTEKSSKKSKVESEEDPLADRMHPSYNSITLAFAKRRANDRKHWLSKYDPDNVLENNQKTVTIPEFINQDLIHFSFADNERSIPSMCDGFKPSQRKILFGSIHMKLDKREVKVEELSGYVSAVAAYHHGGASMQGTIVGMAQDYVGANNINLLLPNGQFGTRRTGGKDSASARYIHTELNKLTSLIFRKEDEPIYIHVVDDGKIVEPQTYAPVIPMILVNGTDGIGTGFSTCVPCYNPKDLVACLKAIMNGEELPEIKPWYYGFKGTVTPQTPLKKDGQPPGYVTEGCHEIVNKNLLKISELPIGYWTDSFISHLEGITVDGKDKKGKTIENYINYSNNVKIDVHVTMRGGILQKILKKSATSVEKTFKLTKNVSVSNMHLYDSNNKLKKYVTVHDIIRDFYAYRINMYTRRKAYYLKALANQMRLLKYKVKFIRYIVEKKIIISKKTKQYVLEKLEELKFPKLSLHVKVFADVIELSESDDDEEKGKYKKSYNYLTGMQLFSLTKEKIDELQEEYDSKVKEYDDYKNTSEKDMWERELDEFSNAYDPWLKARIQNDEEDGEGGVKAKKGKRKLKVGKRKAKVGGKKKK